MQDTEKASPTSYPKIELHVHLEATVRPETLLEIARRNDIALPADTVEGIRELYDFRDFDHFIEVWILTTNALKTADDFRRVVVDYAEDAARHGAVYIEGIFSPIERTWRGVGWDDIFSGYCDGAQEARALHGVDVRLTPDITRGAAPEDGVELVGYAAKYRDRGVVGVGLGGQGGRGGRQMEMLMQGITLTDAQKAAVDSIGQAYRAQMPAFTPGQPMDSTARAKRTAVTQQQYAAVRGVLTADQQATFDKNLETMRARMASGSSASAIWRRKMTLAAPSAPITAISFVGQA